MQNKLTKNIRAALEMMQPCRCNGPFVCTRCQALADLDALALEPESRGAALIAVERARQVAVEGWTPEHDAQHTKGELAMAAAYYCWPCADKKLCQKLLFPDNWSGTHAKREGDRVPTMRDLEKAGALIAAEIDRRLAAGEEA